MRNVHEFINNEEEESEALSHDQNFTINIKNVIVNGIRYRKVRVDTNPSTTLKG